MMSVGFHGHVGEEAAPFVGRERELIQLRQVAAGTRALTLCGAAGIGKTRLAIRLAAELADGFADGAWFVELADLGQPDLVASRAASVIGVVEEPGRPLAATLADALRPRRSLLVLDNCEHLIDACAVLCQQLLASSPGLSVIASSREPLRVAAETVWQVPPMSMPGPGEAPDNELMDSDALRLFAERAAAVRPDFVLGRANLKSAAAICRAVDGLPLAIELAAAWVRVLSVEQIADRLDHRLALLTSTYRAAPVRQQTVRATLDWSFDLLSHSQQVLFRRLSALAGWTLEMAEQVCAFEEIAPADVLDLLSALADKSLVEPDPDTLGEVRYRMLETVREYAAGRLAEAGEVTGLQQRRRDYVVAKVELAADVGMARVAAPWSARVEVFQRFDLEAANIREVLGDCLAAGDAAAGLRICTAARPVWLVRGAFAEAARWYDGLLALPAAAALHGSVRGPALVGRAQLALASGSDRAAAVAEASLAACRAAGQWYWVATALNLLTEIALHAGALEVAASRADEALLAAREADDQWNEAYALGTKAAVTARLGEFDEAERLAAESLVIMRSIRQLWGAARAMLGLGDLALLRAEPDT